MAAASASSANRDMETSMERLSTGKRINSAKDDAAGVAIASRLSSEIRGNNQAIRNAQDGQGMINTAEGAHKEIENILQRMRELAVQSANDTNDSTDRTNLQSEMSSLTTEIDRIAEATTWAGQKLLTGTGGNNGDGTFVLQVGGKTSSENQITAAVTAMTAAALGIGEGSVSASADASTMTEVGNNALQLAGTPAAGDVFNLTVGGTDLAVKLISVADTPVVAVPSDAQTNGTDLSVSGNTLTVNAGATGSNDSFNITVNGTDIQVTTTAADSAAVTATAIKTAIDAVSDLGVSVTDNSDGTLTFEPTTEYAVSLAPTATATMTFDGAFDEALVLTQSGLTGFAQTGTTLASLASDLAATDEILSASVASNGTDIEIIFADTTATNFTLVDSGSAEATVGTVVKGGEFGATQTAIVGNGIEGASAAIAAAVNARTSTDFLGLTATAGTDGSVSIAQAINISASNFEDGSGAAVGTLNADGNEITMVAVDAADTKVVDFTINGETITATSAAADQFDETVPGMVARLQAEIDGNDKLGGLGIVVTSENGDADIKIAITAETTDLIKDVSTDAASATAATTGLSVGSAAGALLAIDAIDTAIQSVNGQRASLGAVSNRLDSTVSNLTNVSINLEGGRSRIEDADFAAESTSLAKSQILAQASTAMLAQANASKQNVLSLLQG